MGISHRARLGSLREAGLIGEDAEGSDEEDEEDPPVVVDEDPAVAVGSDLTMTPEMTLTLAAWSMETSSASANLCVCTMLHVNWSISSPSRSEGLLQTGHFQKPPSPLALR